ncbi:hypothetical protein [Streptomyces chartreusis]|uniref:hypothetical protein n=1 Tax=Streptomyces chartreusis TaxID=1969 RepID=UPI00363B0984
MSVPAPAIPFLVRLADGRTWGAVEFPGGFVCVHHPDEYTLCTIATSVEALVTDRTPGDALHGAIVEQYDSPSEGKRDHVE